MSDKITAEQVRDKVKEGAQNIEQGREEGGYEDLHDGIFIQTDEMFCDLVGGVNVKHYDLQTMLDTMQPVATILKVAEEDSWIEDDSGLWEGLPPYGILASVAFWSLEHVLMEKLNERDNDLPEL